MIPLGWKISTSLAACVSMVLGVALVLSYVENRRLVDQINNPKTGLVVRLAQSQTNLETVQVALDRQNAALREQRVQAEARLSATKGELSEAQKRNREQARRIEKLVALPPKGDTLEDRYSDIDKRLLESLK